MPNGTYGGVRGKETKVDQKTFVSRPTRFMPIPFAEDAHNKSSGPSYVRAAARLKSIEKLIEC